LENALLYQGNDYLNDDIYDDPRIGLDLGRYYERKLPDTKKRVIVMPLLIKPGLDASDMTNFSPIIEFLTSLFNICARLALMQQIYNNYC